MVKKIAAVLLMYFLPSFLYANVSGTTHDFSKESWSKGETCLVCHTSHNANSALLWNHERTGASYRTYNNLNGAITQPSTNTSTRMCLSCHDGTVAIDSFGSRIGTRFINEEVKIGTDLRTHHPVSIEYAASKTWHLKDPSSPSGLGKTIEEDLLKDGKVECSSCHNVHSKNKWNLIQTENACVCHKI